MPIIPECPKFKRGDCPRSDVVCLSETEVNGDYFAFGCRTCRCGFAVSTPRGVAHAAFVAALNRQRSLRPTAQDKLHFTPPQGGWR